MVKKLNGEDVDRIELLKSWNVYVLAFSYIQENAVYKKQERLYIQMLTPT